MCRFMTLVASTAMKAAISKNSVECSLEDLLFALEDWHILGPHIDEADCEALLDFLEWIKGPGPQRALQVGRLQPQVLSALGAAQGAALATKGVSEMQSSGAKVDTHADWLQQMVNKQILMGHHQKYKSTVFGEEPPSPPHSVAGEEFVTDGLREIAELAEPAYPSIEAVEANANGVENVSDAPPN